MTDPSDDPPDLFDGVEEPNNNQNEPPNQPSLINGVANLVAWKVIDTYHDVKTEPEDRPRGILSKADREYLYGLKEYAYNQSEANRRQDIRKRIENALKDFKMLWVLLDASEREQLFDEMGDQEVDDSIEAIVTFLYLGLDRDISRFEKRIERGVLAGENASIDDRTGGVATEADVSIEVNHDPDLEQLYEKVRNGKYQELTPADIGALVRGGKLTPDDLDALQRTNSQFPKVYSGREDQ